MDYQSIHLRLPLSIKELLKPTTCKSCKDSGYSSLGVCKKCLENQAKNLEWLETHPFIFDNEYRKYHTNEHDHIKALPLRLPNEHPYLYYGIEIEVSFDSGYVCIEEGDEYYDEEPDNDDINDILAEFSNITDGLFVYESDSSLTNGVELISRPCSYAYWSQPETVKKLQEGLDYLISRGAYREQPDTNGLHVHISRKFFDYGNTTLSDREMAYQGIDWLFQKFQTEIEHIGQRKYTGYCSSKTDQLKNNLVNNWTLNAFNVEAELKCKLKKGGRVPERDHNVAVTMSGGTIEARVFKSTTDAKQVLAFIEFMRNIAHAVRDDNTEVSFDSLIHTKENKFLDNHVRNIRKQCTKRGEKLDLEKVNDNCIEVVIKK